MAHTFNNITQKAEEAGQISVGSRSAWSAGEFQVSQAYIVRPCLLNKISLFWG